MGWDGMGWDGMGWDGMRGTALAAAGLPDLCCSSRRAYLLRAGLGWAGDVYRLREHAPYELVGIGYFCLREYDVGQREAGGFGISIGIGIGVATSGQPSPS